MLRAGEANNGRQRQRSVDPTQCDFLFSTAEYVERVEDDADLWGGLFAHIDGGEGNSVELEAQEEEEEVVFVGQQQQLRISYDYPLRVGSAALRSGGGSSRF